MFNFNTKESNVYFWDRTILGVNSITSTVRFSTFNCRVSFIFTVHRIESNCGRISLVKMIVCNFSVTCDRAFVEKSQLSRHQKIHSDEMPFACTRCNFRTKRKDKLKNHLAKIHKETTWRKLSDFSLKGYVNSIYLCFQTMQCQIYEIYWEDLFPWNEFFLTPFGQQRRSPTSNSHYRAFSVY